MRSLQRLILSALAVSVLTQCATRPDLRTNTARESRLASLGYEPLRLTKTAGDSRYSGYFQVNGKDVHLLIDSGANSTDLNYDVARACGITPEKSVKVVSRGALGRPVASWVGLGALGAGSVTATPFPFMLAPSSRRHTATSRYDGQLGIDALNGLASLVDLRMGTLWIPGPRAGNTQREGITALGRQDGLGLHSLPLEPAGRLPHLLVECRYEDRRLTWVVDTGAEVTVMASESASRLSIPTVESRSKIIDASGDRASVRSAVLHNLLFGQLLVHELQVAVTPLGPIRQTFRDRSGRPVDGIIGMDFLEESSALLDAASQMLYLGE
ncbi:MAG: aspartyl protease family protein [Roseibacillus sp.]|nr:aspartyl protease family protein [Roseibacillus sp.]